MCDADVIGRTLDSSAVSTLSKSSSLSEHLLLHCAADQPDVITSAVDDDRTLMKLQQLEPSHAQLTQELAATSTTLRHRTLGFEAMTVLVKHLVDEVVPRCVF